MTEPRQFLQKIIRMRQQLIKTGCSKKNTLLCAQAIRKIKPWLDAYPHATAAQVAAHIKRNYNAVVTLMPGTPAPHAEKFQNELNLIIHHYENLTTHSR